MDLSLLVYTTLFVAACKIPIRESAKQPSDLPNSAGRVTEGASQVGNYQDVPRRQDELGRHGRGKRVFPCQIRRGTAGTPDAN